MVPARVVDEDVEAAEVTQHVGAHPLHVRAACEVHGDRDGASPRLLGLGGHGERGLAVHVRYCYLCPFAGQGHGDRAPDAATASRDQRGPSFPEPVAWRRCRGHGPPFLDAPVPCASEGPGEKAGNGAVRPR